MRPHDLRILKRARFTGGPVAVVALYQSGRVRADVLGLLMALRRKGVYVIAINTGQLDDKGAQLPVDLYAERPNLGRDFGSYKAGMTLLRDLGPAPSRLMLFNDSVFYAASGLAPFIDRLMASKADVCSATESTEVRPHQTSFCISFSQSCFKSTVFRRFWDRYVPADLRPATVLFGEIALSRVLTQAGFSHDVIASRKAVQDQLARQPELANAPSGFAESAPAEWCVAGNVTHRAPRALLELGVPLVKLDLPKRVDIAEKERAEILSRLSRAESETLDSIWQTGSAPMKRTKTLDKLGALCGLA